MKNTVALNKRKTIQMAHQRGATLIAAVFLITALSVLGVFLSRVMVTTSQETINEFFSAQALYAAESGVDFAAYQLVHGGAGAASTVDATVDTVSWFTTVVAPIVTAGGQTVYQITSTGKAGNAAASPLAQRTLVIQFKP